MIELPGEIEFSYGGDDKATDTTFFIVVECREDAEELVGHTIRVQGKDFVVTKAKRSPCGVHPDMERWLHVTAMAVLTR
jgi:hypothetical protein